MINAARFVKRFWNEQIKERYVLHRLKPALSHKVNPPVNEDKKNIFFNTHYPWFYIWIEYVLAKQLENRGHQVNMLICDGLPYCEQETLTTPRPSCDSCFKRIKRHLDTFNLPYQTISAWLTDRDRNEAKMLASSLTVEQIKVFASHGVPIGEISYRNLIHYYKGIHSIQDQIEKKFRQIFESALLIFYASIQYFEKNKIDAVVSANGKFIQSGIGVEHAAYQQIPFYTWEVFNQFTGAIFAKNGIALEQNLNDVWDVEKDIPLTDEQKAKIYRNFADQAASKNTPFLYNESHYDASHHNILQRFQLKQNKPIIVVFPNVEWDSTAMIPSGFDSMLDWLIAIIDYGINHPDYQIIIRAHPGELKVPADLKTTTPICDRIRHVYPNFPANIHLIGATDEISSYALAEIANVIMVYSSTMGLEFALRGMKPWVSANIYYAQKGFTLDIQSKVDLYDRLKNREFNLKLNEQELAYAERLAYIVRYRRLFAFPFFEKDGFNLQEYLKQGDKNKVINNICDLIEGKRNCLDLGEANW